MESIKKNFGEVSKENGKTIGFYPESQLWQLKQLVFTPNGKTIGFFRPSRQSIDNNVNSCEYGHKKSVKITSLLMESIKKRIYYQRSFRREQQNKVIKPCFATTAVLPPSFCCTASSTAALNLTVGLDNRKNPSSKKFKSYLFQNSDHLK